MQRPPPRADSNIQQKQMEISLEELLLVQLVMLVMLVLVAVLRLPYYSTITWE
jgi:hypothetical protein